jgi:hypothetical protein
MVISNSPLQVTLVQYSSDRRIKQDIYSVDEDSLFEKMMNVKIKSYRYTDEWRAVRNIKDTRVRGVIAQELAEVFPEHVKIIPKYDLEDKGFQLTDFYQVDKMGLILDIIGALQAMQNTLKCLVIHLVRLAM